MLGLEAQCAKKLLIGAAVRENRAPFFYAEKGSKIEMTLECVFTFRNQGSFLFTLEI